MDRRIVHVSALLAFLSMHCGGASAPNTITISSYAFSPANLTVSSGTTVTVRNEDSVQHSVTSEAALNAVTPGAVSGIQFDTGPFAGTATFTISSGASSGTIIPYFCTVHGSMMGNGTLTIR
jgi:plastocyanin